MGGSGGTGGGDNQLARWFSPELLARASAGKLPSVHVPNALSLEDLERHHHSPAPPVRNWAWPHPASTVHIPKGEGASVAKLSEVP